MFKIFSLYSFVLSVSPPRWSRRPAFHFLFSDPIVGIAAAFRENKLSSEFHVFVEVEHASGVLVFSAVVGRAKDSNQLAICELLDAVHDALVRSNDLVQVGLAAETGYAVGPELDDVAALVRVAHAVGVDALLFVRVSGVAPEDVHHQQVLLSLDLVHDL